MRMIERCCTVRCSFENKTMLFFGGWCICYEGGGVGGGDDDVRGWLNTLKFVRNEHIKIYDEMMLCTVHLLSPQVLICFRKHVVQKNVDVGFQ